MDYDGVVALFAPDCSFGRADVWFHGHDGLRQSLNSRPRDRMTRHIASNVVIDVADADHAAGKAYCLVFGHRGRAVGLRGRRARRAGFAHPLRGGLRPHARRLAHRQVAYRLVAS